MALKPNRLTVERARRQLQRENLRATGGNPESASFHSGSYHKAFDGYVEVKRLTTSGRSAIHRIYVGNYYEPDEPTCRRVFRRILYSLLHAASLLCFFRSATADTGVNFSIPANLFQACLFLTLLLKSYVLLFYIPALNRLTEGDFRSLHAPLVRLSLAAAVLFAGNAFCTLWVCVTQAVPTIILSVLLPLTFGTAAEFILGLWEKKLPYRILPNDTPIPPDAAPITANEASHI